jgi:hypothetical protein
MAKHLLGAIGSMMGSGGLHVPEPWEYRAAAHGIHRKSDCFSAITLENAGGGGARAEGGRVINPLPRVAWP